MTKQKQRKKRWTGLRGTDRLDRSFAGSFPARLIKNPDRLKQHLRDQSSK